MTMSKHTYLFSSLLILLVLALFGCGGAPVITTSEPPAAADNDTSLEAGPDAAIDPGTSAEIDPVANGDSTTKHHLNESDGDSPPEGSHGAETDLDFFGPVDTEAEGGPAAQPLLDEISSGERANVADLKEDAPIAAADSSETVGTGAGANEVAGAVQVEPAPAVQSPTDGTSPDRFSANGGVETDQTLQSPANNTTSPESSEAVPFTATPGLERLRSYRMNFEADFDGSQQGQPASGTISGLFEVTKAPSAQHWLINTSGETLRQLVPMSSVELYDIENTMHFQNPQNGAWMSLPKFLVEGMLPEGLSNPEDSIELPQTAVLQPGQEIVNGVTTRRYTFGPDDVAVDGASFESVDGTIWVAVDGDFIVKYKADVTGQFEDFAVGGMRFLDEGTLTMMYELNDINGEFTIEAPVQSSGFSLSDLFK
jgi:hypothetical protein